MGVPRRAGFTKIGKARTKTSRLHALVGVAAVVVCSFGVVGFDALDEAFPQLGFFGAFPKVGKSEEVLGAHGDFGTTFRSFRAPAAPVA